MLAMAGTPPEHWAHLGRSGSPSHWKRDSALRPGLRSKPRRAGWPGKVATACSCLWKRKPPLRPGAQAPSSESPTATSPLAASEGWAPPQQQLPAPPHCASSAEIRRRCPTLSLSSPIEESQNARPRGNVQINLLSFCQEPSGATQLQSVEDRREGSQGGWAPGVPRPQARRWQEKPLVPTQDPGHTPSHGGVRSGSGPPTMPHHTVGVRVGVRTLVMPPHMVGGGVRGQSQDLTVSLYVGGGKVTSRLSSSTLGVQEPRWLHQQIYPRIEGTAATCQAPTEDQTQSGRPHMGTPEPNPAGQPSRTQMRQQQSDSQQRPLEPSAMLAHSRNQRRLSIGKPVVWLVRGIQEKIVPPARQTQNKQFVKGSSIHGLRNNSAN